ncbi:MAG: hypothetical protein AAF264_13060 [Pseudomonadota bacterium]
MPLWQIFPAWRMDGMLNVLGSDATADRCAVAVEVTVPDLWSQFDRLGRAQGNVGSESDRLYWVGPTQLRVINGYDIRLQSRTLTESWAAVEDAEAPETRDTSTVNLTVSPSWDGSSQTLALDYDMDGAAEVPKAIEDVMAGFGAHLNQSIQLAPSEESADGYGARFEKGPSFSHGSRSKGLVISFTASADLDEGDCASIVGAGEGDAVPLIRGLAADLARG